MKKQNLAVRWAILITQGLSVLLYVGVVYFAIITLTLIFTGSAPFKTTYGFSVPTEKVEDGLIDWNGQQTKVKYSYDNQVIKIPSDKVGSSLAIGVNLFVSLVFFTLICVARQFLRFLRTVETDEVFKLTNVKRLRNIAFILMIYSIILPFYKMIIGYILTPPRVYFSFEFNYLFFGIFLLVITEVLKAGLNIKSENELTI